MITKSFASRQILRLGCLAGSRPSDESAQEELVSALQRHALNDGHAVRIIDQWLQSSRFWPVPIDIAETAESVPASDAKLKKDKNCPSCHGTGWEVVYTLDTYEVLPDGSCYKRREIIRDQHAVGQLQARVDGKKQIVYSNARRCTHCNYGKTLTSESRNPEDRTGPELPIVDESKLPKFGPPKAKPANKATEPQSRKLRFITAQDVQRAIEDNRKQNEGNA